jgi:hypothetical protein
MSPTYCFERLEDGARVEAFYPMRLAPKIGKVVELDGKMCRRTAHFAAPFTEDQRKFARYPYRSRAQARKEHLPKAVQECSKFTKDGTLIIRSPAHEKRVMGIMGMERA